MNMIICLCEIGPECYENVLENIHVGIRLMYLTYEYLLFNYFSSEYIRPSKCYKIS